MTKLSIIIPVYKVEKYIEKCIKSLLNQDLDSEEYEMIFIDDGSPDNSKEIVSQYSTKHDNIKLIAQDNNGVSSARNRGLEIAKGAYIAFVDSDDTIYKNSLSPILKRAFRDNLDILYLSIELFNEKGDFLRKFEPNGNEEVIQNGFIHPRRTFLSTLYKKEIIGDIRYTEGITRGQDTIFNAMVQAKAKRCSYCKIPYYKYTERETSSRQFIKLEKTFKSNLLAIDTIISYKYNNFPECNRIQKEYFDNVVKLFAQRSIEWSIMPEYNKRRFDTLKNKLKEKNFDYIIRELATSFKFFNKSFFLFYIYHHLKKVYYNTLGLGSKIKRKIIHA